MSVEGILLVLWPWVSSTNIGIPESKDLKKKKNEDKRRIYAFIQIYHKIESIKLLPIF